MSRIILTNVSKSTVSIKTVPQYLAAVDDWVKTNVNTVDEGSLSRVWYRGVGDMRPDASPGVFRNDPGCKFTTQANSGRSWGANPEERRLHLEMKVLHEFRALAVSTIDPADFISVYLNAQHFGLPTRLLDWTTNPLTGLFFAVSGLDSSKDGEVIVMDSLETLLPKDATTGERELPNILGVRHPQTKQAIGEIFWQKPKADMKRIIFPMRPDNVPGRIGQQSSCFTVHTYKAPNVDRPNKMLRVPIKGTDKAELLTELHRMNVSEFTIYQGLDHLSKTLKTSWGLT